MHDVRTVWPSGPWQSNACNLQCKFVNAQMLGGKDRNLYLLKAEVIPGAVYCSRACSLVQHACLHSETAWLVHSLALHCCRCRCRSLSTSCSRYATRWTISACSSRWGTLGVGATCADQNVQHFSVCSILLLHAGLQRNLMLSDLLFCTIMRSAFSATSAHALGPANPKHQGL